jgi:hypothetical protein
LGVREVVGYAWADDLRVLQGLGLKYVLFEFQPGDDPPALLELDHDRLIRRSLPKRESAQEQVWPLPRFLEQFAGEIESLATRFRSQTEVDWKSASVVVTNKHPFAPRDLT